MADFIKEILPETGGAGITDVKITLTGKHTGREQRTATRTITFESNNVARTKVMKIVQAGAPITTTASGDTTLTVEIGQKIVLEGYSNSSTLSIETNDNDYDGDTVSYLLSEIGDDAPAMSSVQLTEGGDTPSGTIENISKGKANRYSYTLTFTECVSDGSFTFTVNTVTYNVTVIPSLAGADITESGATSTVNFTADETEKTVKVGAKKGFSITKDTSEHPGVIG